MQIYWTTLVLEIINFLVLVLILKRFLYRPVMEAIAARQQRVEGKLAEARAIEDGARELQQQYQRRLADWDMEKAKVRAALDTELLLERNRQMQALDKALLEERERIAAVTAHKQQEAQCELEVEALAHAQRFAAALMARLADPVVEARFVDLLFEDWAKLPETQLQSLRRAVLVDKAKATVTTAFPLSAEQRQRIEAALAGRLEAGLAVAFDEDPNLLAGVRLSLGPWQLNMNFADELASFKAAANHVL